jgi:hypothetical protein
VRRDYETVVALSIQEERMPTFLHGTLGGLLPPMRLVSRVQHEYAGACPFCGGDQRRSDRFHVWLTPGRERYWCRRCERRGPTAELIGSAPRTDVHQQPSCLPAVEPRRSDITRYRRLYELVASWAERNVCDPINPAPLAYLRLRGFDLETIRWASLGYALDDATSLVDHIRVHAPELNRYAEAAGLATQATSGLLLTHPNLRGRIVIPYLHDGAIIDLRTRRIGRSGYTSLAGSYALRGATVPYGWDTLASDVVIITEGELKALAAQAAFRAGVLPYPAIAHPGVNYFRAEWATWLARRGIRVAILAYDARAVRPTDADGRPTLAPEERWTLRHGRTLQAAGISVFVLSLPPESAGSKQDLDGFVRSYGSGALVTLLLRTPLPLDRYRSRIPQALLQAAGF